MEKRIYWIVGVVIAIILMLFAYTFLRSNASQKTKNTPKKISSELPTQKADSIAVVYSKDGVITLRMKAPTLIPKDTQKEKYNEFPDGVKMTFFGKEGEKSADLWADYGKDDAKNFNRMAKGNVNIVTPAGDTYVTEELFMDIRKDSIHNNGKYVKITRKDGTFIQGKGFRSDGKMKNITIEETLPSTVPVKENNLQKSL